MPMNHLEPNMTYDPRIAARVAVQKNGRIGAVIEAQLEALGINAAELEARLIHEVKH